MVELSPAFFSRLYRCYMFCIHVLPLFTLYLLFTRLRFFLPFMLFTLLFGFSHSFYLFYRLYRLHFPVSCLFLYFYIVHLYLVSRLLCFYIFTFLDIFLHFYMFNFVSPFFVVCVSTFFTFVYPRLLLFFFVPFYPFSNTPAFIKAKTLQRGCNKTLVQLCHR